MFENAAFKLGSNLFKLLFVFTKMFKFKTIKIIPIKLNWLMLKQLFSYSDDDVVEVGSV